jgi:membrane dipeptidase
MQRRRVLCRLGQLALGLALPQAAWAQSAPRRFVDMHTPLGFRPSRSVRDAMARGGMLMVVDKIVADGPLLQQRRGRHTAIRRAQPGELRANFERELERRLKNLARESLPHIRSVQDLDRCSTSMKPAVVLGSEGADFLEGDIGYLQAARARGLVHLQLVHYYTPSLVGDIATEPATHAGLSAFGKELVRACNRLGILVDVAHCSSAGIEQALELSTKPILYSHGHASEALPHPSQDVDSARAIHRPLAQRIADKGGVIGLWPLAPQFRDLARFADELVAMAKRFGPRHVGIGTDINGLPGTVIPSYGEFALLPALLEQRGLGATDIAAVLGENYLRLLRQALQIQAA